MPEAFDPEFAIETPRLYLSLFDAASDAHCDFLVELYTSEEAIAGFGNSGIDTREKARAFIGGFMRTMLERNGYGPWLVSLKLADRADGAYTTNDLEATSFKLARSTPVGTVTMMRGEEPDAFAVPDIGFVTHPDHMRRGYTKEACLAAMDYTTRAYGVHKFLGMTDPHNKPANAVFRSLGFKDHGVHPIKVFGGEPGVVWTSDTISDLSLIGF